MEIYSKIIGFHSICPPVFEKNGSVTTKSLNSNYNKNVSSSVVHRNNRVALRNKLVLGSQWGLITRHTAKLCLCILSVLVYYEK